MDALIRRTRSWLVAAALLGATALGGCEQEPESPAQQLRGQVEHSREEQRALLSRQEEIDGELAEVREQQRELGVREEALERESRQATARSGEQQDRAVELSERVQQAELRREQGIVAEQVGEQELAERQLAAERAAQQAPVGPAAR